MDERDELITIADQMLVQPELHREWPRLLDQYSYLGFTDNISDADRIKEFTWIIKELRKLISKQSTVLRNMRNLEETLGYLTALQKRTKSGGGGTEYPEDRMHLVYSVMRDDWIEGYIQNVESSILTREETEDGWNY